MVGSGIELLRTLIVELPNFVLLGMVVTLIAYSLVDGTKPIFEPAKRSASEFDSLGGAGPALSGALLGIVAGIVMEMLLILALAALTVSGSHFGFDDFLRGSAFAILIGIVCALWVFEWAEFRIRESDVYRGFW